MNAPPPVSTLTPTPIRPTPTIPLPATPILQVEPWPDRVMDRTGHDPRSAYAEQFWLAVLGPSASWLLRRLADRLDDSPTGFSLDCSQMSWELGLQGHTGKNSIFMRSIDRCCRFGLAQRHGDKLFVRLTLPSLASRQIDRLPPRLARLHRAWQPGSSPADGSPVEQLVTRAQRLALTLLELGEDRAATERQLHEWHFHPSIVGSATEWAVHRHRDTDHRRADASSASDDGRAEGTADQPGEQARSAS